MGADALMETTTLQQSDKGAGVPGTTNEGEERAVVPNDLDQGAVVPVTNVQVAIEPSSGADITNIINESDWWDTMLGVDGADLTVCITDPVSLSQLGAEEDAPASGQPGTPLHGFLVQVQWY